MRYVDNGQVVLITGCSSGMGRELCSHLKEQGYIVVATARNLDKLSDVDADKKMQLDVTNEEQTLSVVQEIITEFGRIDVLINNAGYSIRCAVEEMDLADTTKMFDTNVYGVIRMIKAVAPYMRSQNYGKIINIGSISGKMTSIINGGYCATKHAIEAISEAARYELGSYGVQVTVLEPGAMDTGFFRTLADNSDANMNNTNSPYYLLYQNDMIYRKKQKRASLAKSADQVIKVIQKKKLKARYTISLPIMFSILIRLPDGLRERLILKFS